MNKNALPYEQTPETVKQYLCLHGITLKQWANDNGFSYNLVKDVMYGRVKGSHGTSHHIAVALGFKPDPNLVSTGV